MQGRFGAKLARGGKTPKTCVAYRSWVMPSINSDSVRHSMKAQILCMEARLENENSPIEGRRLPRSLREAERRGSEELRRGPVSHTGPRERHRLATRSRVLFTEPLFLGNPCLLRRSSIYLPIIIPRRQRLKYRLQRALPSLLLPPPQPFNLRESLPPSSIEHLYLAISRPQPTD